MTFASLAQLGAMLDPQHFSKLQAIDHHAVATFQVGSALDAQRHQQRLAELDRELGNRLTLLRAQAHIDTEQDLTRSIIKQMEGRSATRNEMAKMILAAGIQARLGKLAHERTLAEQYAAKRHEYIFEVLRMGLKREAEAYIDEMYEQQAARI